MALVKPADVVPLSDLGRVHLAGIGGAGMSGIARVMLARGLPVSGSDAADSTTLKELQALGAQVHVGHDAANLGDADTLVVSSAIREDNPELAQARQRGLRVLHRAGALASLAASRRVIAVTGTHGKTTTTSMITTILLGTGAQPGYVIGGTLASTGVNAADGPGRDFVAEADESDGSFLMLSPDVAVITNVDADHLDNYGTVEAYRASFAAFCERIVPGGLLVTCADDPGAAQVAARAADRGVLVRTYGESAGADYRVTGVTVAGMTTSFTVTADRGPDGTLTAGARVGVPGRHNALNATAALATAIEIGVAPQAAAEALGTYQGAGRRMELKGEASGVRVLDTYAHHPTELRRGPGRSQGDRRRRARDRGLPAAPVQPHADLRPRVRHRARAGRRGHRA